MVAMKIVLLDFHFESMGGGEKLVAVMAEHLARNNDVTVLVAQPVDAERVKSYFDVDLEGVRFEQVVRERSLFGRLMTSGVKVPGRWMSIMLDRASLKALRALDADLFINVAYQSNLPSPVSRSIYMCMFPQKMTFAAQSAGLTRKVYNKISDMLELGLLGSRNDAISSYAVVAGISEYSAGWIQRYWGREAELVYPVCDDMGPPAQKKKIILSVGRFFADDGSSHHKRHDELIAAFLRLDRLDWELHLAGSLAGDGASQAYFAHLVDSVKSHANIFIHRDMAFSELKQLRRESSLYWHATGLHYDAERFPESQEHFGIVTVEAMSAGVVPVVYDSAGQKEIVQHGQNGVLWHTIDELLMQTNELIDDDELRSRLAAAATERAKDFDRRSFTERVDSIVTTLIH